MQVRESAKEVAIGGNKLSIKGGKFSYKGASLGEELKVIILSSAFVNEFYNSDFDPESITPPACFAINQESEEALQPHDSSPEKQNDICHGCPQNEWGTGKGKGKACSNRRRLALINAEDEDFAESEIVMLSIGPTSLKNWKGYVKSLEKKLQRPPFAVVTTLTFDDEADWPVIEFELTHPIEDDEQLEIIMSRIDEGSDIVLTPFDVSGYKQGTKSPKKEKQPAKAKSRFSKQ
jgi:hypothetical protein